MAHQTIDNRIKITHFVNPHVFYFKWVRDEGYNEELNTLERKIEKIARQRIEEGENREKKIRIFEVVAVFVPDWHKYVRAAIKKKERDDFFCVWLIDYGHPMVVNACNIEKLPSAFQGMQMNSKRIYTGGIENCLPAEKVFDINKESSVKEMQLNWSPHAIQLVQNILNQAIKLEFEHIQDLMPLKRSHLFGRLMMQRPSDGQMVNVMKCLLEMNMAVLAEGEFKDELMTIESLHQTIYLSVNNESLDMKMCVEPIKTVANDTGYTNSDIFESDNENASLIDKDELNDLSAEDNEFFDDSASVVHPKVRFEISAGNALAPVLENESSKENIVADSNANQSKSKSTDSKDKSENDAQSNSTSAVEKNGGKQQSKKRKKNALKQRNRDRACDSKPNNNQSEYQQRPQQQQQQKQPQSNQSPPQQQKQKQNEQQQQQQNRQINKKRQSGAQQRVFNGEQNSNHSNFQHLEHVKSSPHSIQNHNQHSSHSNFRKFPPNAELGCPEFEASLGKPPPGFSPYGFSSPIGAPVPVPYPFKFTGMFSPSPQRGPPHQARVSNFPPRFQNRPGSFENSSNQMMNMMPSMNIHSPNFPNNANQRGQNRMRNRDSRFQGQFNNRPANNAGKMKANGNIEKRNMDEIKPHAVQKNSAPSKVDSEKSKSTTGEW